MLTFKAKQMVEKCFPKEVKSRQDKLTQTLKDFYGTKKKGTPNEIDGALFFKSLTGMSREKKEGNYFNEDRKIFIKNLLMLEDFFGRPRNAQVMMGFRRSKDNYDQDKKNMFDVRRNELKILAEKYTQFVKDADAIAENLFNNPDFEEVDVFKVAVVNGDKDSTEPVSSDNQEHKFREINFFGLSEVDEIHQLEQSDSLSESQLMARKAILYTDLGNKDLALQCADDALKIDPENGVAWMFKGFLSLQLDAEFNSYPKSLSEINNHVDHNDIIKFLMNAWRFLPNTLKEMMPYKGYTSAPVYPYHSFYNEKCLIRTFIRNAKQLNAYVFPDEISDAKKIFLDLLERDFGKLSFTDQTLTPYYFMKLLPLVHEVDSEGAKQLAQRWVDSILSVKPDSNLLNDGHYKFGIENLNKELYFLTELGSDLSFDVISELSQHISILCSEFERQRHLENFNHLCQKQFKKSDGDLFFKLKVCDSVLKSSLFKDADFDQCLLKQWSYPKLRLIAAHAFECIDNDDWDGLATFFTESISTNLLEYANGLDFYDIPMLHSMKNKEVWCNVLHKNIESALNVRPNEYHKVKSLEGYDHASLQGKSILSFLLEVVLKNISGEPKVADKLMILKSECDQMFQAKTKH